MKISIPFDSMVLDVDLPDDTVVYRSEYPHPESGASRIVLDAIRNPVNSSPLAKALAGRRGGKVVIVVSDITRPIPYKEFLPVILEEIAACGIERDCIQILIAAGMHRPGTEEEREYLLGAVAKQYAILDHDAEGPLEKIPGLSRSGREIFLNKDFVNAGFRIITGLVEPHFMAGFSGGRKAVCPGLASMETIQSFHGYEFLNSPRAINSNLDRNPCHEESLSVARLAGVDFSLNVVLDAKKRVVKAFAGHLEDAHDKACAFVGDHACPVVGGESDVVIVGCGGYPLDATFYQCVKGIAAAVPAVKKGGMIIAAGGCVEGIGSREYRAIMREHAADYKGFLDRIGGPGPVRKDQWQFQMQVRALEKVGYEGLVFFGCGIDGVDTGYTATRYVPVTRDSASRDLQLLIDGLIAAGKSFAVIPEGPYCTPVAGK